VTVMGRSDFDARELDLAKRGDGCGRSKGHLAKSGAIKRLVVRTLSAAIISVVLSLLPTASCMKR
jgi:hypothetical protein